MNDQISLKKFRKSTEKLLPNIKKLSEDDFDIFWFDGFYDGPLNGILSFENKEYRYEIVNDYTKVIYPRIFAVVDITDDEVKEEKYWNDLYIKFIKSNPGNEESRNEFFKHQEKRKEINYTEKKVLWYYIESES